VTENPSELGDKAWGSIPVKVRFDLLSVPALTPTGKFCEATVSQTTTQAAAGVGGASCSIGSVGVGNYVIQFKLLDNSYYKAEVEDQAVTVADPGTGFITGGGWVALDNGQRGNFGFTAKFLTKGNNIQGNSLFIYRTVANLRALGVTQPSLPPNEDRAYNYIVKSNALDGLQTCGVANRTPCSAQLNGRSNIKAVDRLTGIAYNIDASVIGNQQLFELDVTDNGEPGSSPGVGPDIYALRVYTSAGPFLIIGTPAYDPSAISPQPTSLPISGGNIQVRP
jgi:hypothetical protein